MLKIKTLEWRKRVNCGCHGGQVADESVGHISAKDCEQCGGQGWLWQYADGTQRDYRGRIQGRVAVAEAMEGK